MTKVEYLKFHRKCCDRMCEITKNKNEDYTGTSLDAFANFTRVEALEIASTEQGFLTRITDKLCRINSFAQKGFLQVLDESVEDTLLDLANYSILFAGYLKSKKEKQTDLQASILLTREDRIPDCVECHKPVFWSRPSVYMGSNSEGKQFAHPECYGIVNSRRLDLVEMHENLKKIPIQEKQTVKWCKPE